VIVRDLADPDRMRRLGPEGLRRFVARRGVVLQRRKAEQLVEAATVALRLPSAERAPIAALLAADVALLDAVGREIRRAEEALAEVLARTPAGILVSLPGVGVVRASAYGAAVGDPWRFSNAGAAYRASGLVPAEYSSAGRRRGGQRISREGSVELRSAIIELGRGLAGHDHDFAAYRRRLRSTGKRPAVAAVAVGHRAHRLAFTMLRTQQPYDPNRWATAVADGPVMAKTGGRPTRTT
jgi:transposase